MINLKPIATKENFLEAEYLLANPDVKKAVIDGVIESGYAHFLEFGHMEGRRLMLAVPHDAKQKKLSLVGNLINKNMPFSIKNFGYDFLTDDLRSQCNIVSTENISSNSYDGDVKNLINKHKDGFILDAGAGFRDIYYPNVINFEIVDYSTTDVRGVGEALPFNDGVFDAVISNAVLEHVKDPFQCAREILRVLKPGGDLFVCVPFLQPVHGYPHHYYNMTALGLKNLFTPDIDVLRHEVPESTLPIWSLTWILNEWAKGLTGEALSEFRSLRISDLLEDPKKFIKNKFVTELSNDINFIIASATVMHAKKK